MLPYRCAGVVRGGIQLVHRPSLTIDLEGNFVMPEQTPYGSWKSPITPELIVTGGVALGQIALDGDDIYWIEGRPQEGGRNVIVRRTPDGVTTDLTPAPFNARTRVHEYGGGAFAVSEGVVYFSNFSDQRMYCQEPGEGPQPITPEGDLRYADGIVDRERSLMYCVREDHTASGREPVNTLVGLPLHAEGTTKILAEGYDFYSSPRLSPDGSRLAWLSWNHPNMPWDGGIIQPARPRHTIPTVVIFHPDRLQWASPVFQCLVFCIAGKHGREGG
jgi:hypothetical protein